MIHFDFIVSDSDAENIFHALNEEIFKYLDEIRDMMTRGHNEDSLQIKHLNSVIEYYRELKTKMKNTLHKGNENE